MAASPKLAISVWIEAAHGLVHNRFLTIAAQNPHSEPRLRSGMRD